MKTILMSALALAIAVPAAAQTAPATDPHAGHAEHQKGKHDCKACCEKMKGKDGKMECMDGANGKGAEAKADAASADAHAKADGGHAGHDH